ncbi:hypothetical protein QR680_001103 [Steinernema hermaphroditum]|uniref:WH2 domain-containing protein n=1 Tax=Steinernema hermaphroditum TaxID=289476 RepID=A0AA39GYY1_9BILA|nr:hypothetical protein QR680_001103 [Steinernema hermaphroditum]
MNPDNPILAEIRHGICLRPAKHKMVDKSGLRVERDEVTPGLSVVKPELIPAPPPLQPPPPPALNINKASKPVTKPSLLKLGGPSTSVNRDELLKSIRSGISLRKTTINDRSSPCLRSEGEEERPKSISPQPPMPPPQALLPPSLPLSFSPVQTQYNGGQQYSPMSEDDLPSPPSNLPTYYDTKRLSPLPVHTYESEATMRFSPEPPPLASNAPPAPPLPPQMNLRVMAPVYAQPVVPQLMAEEPTKPQLTQAPPQQPPKKSDFVFNEEDLKTSQEQVRAVIPMGSASQRIAMFTSKSNGNGNSQEPHSGPSSGRSTPKMMVRKEFISADKPAPTPTPIMTPVPASIAAPTPTMTPIVRPPLPTSKPPPLPTTAAPEPPINAFSGPYQFQRDENANVNKISAGSVIKQFEETPKEVNTSPPAPKFAPSKAHGAHFAQIRDSFANGAPTSAAPAPVSTGERVWKAAAMASAASKVSSVMNGSAAPNSAPMSTAAEQPKKNVSIPINAPWYVKKSDVGNIGSRNVAIPIRLAEENKLAKANRMNGGNHEIPVQSRITSAPAPHIIASNDRLQRIAQLHPEALHNGYKFDINLNSNDPIALVER